MDNHGTQATQFSGGTFITEFWALVRTVAIELYNAGEWEIERARECVDARAPEELCVFYCSDPLQVTRELLGFAEERLTVWEVVAYDNIIKRLGWCRDKPIEQGTIVTKISELDPVAVEKYWALVRLAATEVFGLAENRTEHRTHRLRVALAKLPEAERLISYHANPLHVAADLVGLARDISQNELSFYLELEDKMGLSMPTDRPD
jgi:hypothetical protein